MTTLNTKDVSEEINVDIKGETSLVDLALLLAENKKKLTLGPLIVGTIAFAGTYLLTPTYTANAQILAPQTQSASSALLGSLGGLAGFAGGFGAVKDPSEQWVSLMTSRTVADHLIKKYNLKEIYKTEYLFQAREKLARNTRISSGKDGLIALEVDDEDPGRATELTQSYIEELRTLTQSLALTEASQRRLFFESQLAEAKANLTKAEIALRSSGINPSILKTSPDATAGTLSELEARAAATEVQIAILKQSQTEQSPQLKAATSEFNSIKQQIQRLSQNNPQDSNPPGSEYISRYRNFKYYETLFDMMARQYELAKADEAKDNNTIQIIDTPSQPEYKTKPKRGAIALAAAVSTFLITVLFLLCKRAIHQYTRIPTQARTWQALISHIPQPLSKQKKINQHRQ